MLSTPIATMVKMLETLPEESQELVAEHLREYVAELQDETQWAAAFKKTQSKLAAAARQAKHAIAEGQAEPMNYNKL